MTEEILKPTAIDGEKSQCSAGEDVKIKAIVPGEDAKEETDKSNHEEAASKERKQMENLNKD